MAQYFFAAEDYTDGTALNELGFVELGSGTDSAKATWSSVDYFNIQSTFFTPRNEVLDDTAGSGDQEILIMFDAPLNNYLTGGNTKFLGAALRDSIGLRVEFRSTTSIYAGNNITGTTATAPQTVDYTKAAALRVRVVGDLYQARAWQADAGTLLANEPATWGWSETLASPATGRAGVHKYTSAYRATHIGIGTGGDSAPGEPTPDPYVETPTPTGATSITSSSARLNWTS